MILWAVPDGVYAVSDARGALVLGPFFSRPDPGFVAKGLAESLNRPVLLHTFGGDYPQRWVEPVSVSVLHGATVDGASLPQPCAALAPSEWETAMTHAEQSLALARGRRADVAYPLRT